MDNALKVPIKDEDGKVKLEDWNHGDLQSDGSQWFKPVKLVADGHEHYFIKKSPEDRHVLCECGFGGDIYPHNAVLQDGHVYDLNGIRKA